MKKKSNGSDFAELRGEIKGTLNEYGREFVEIKHELREISNTLAANTEQLKIHIRSSDANAANLEIAKKEFAERVRPLEDLETVVKGYLKLILFFLALPACFYYMIRIVKEFIK